MSKEAADELAYRERTAKASEQFWSEVREYIEDTEITLDDARLAIRIMCGDTPWEAWSYVYPDSGLTAVMDRKRAADSLYSRQDIHDLVSWAKIRSQELYALDLKAWDWSFKDSEMALRLLIACSEEQLQTLSGNVTQTISNTIIGSVRELNKMYEYDASNYYSDKAKAVIFLHEDMLED